MDDVFDLDTIDELVEIATTMRPVETNLGIDPALELRRDEKGIVAVLTDTKSGRDLAWFHPDILER